MFMYKSAKYKNLQKPAKQISGIFAGEKGYLFFFFDAFA